MFRKVLSNPKFCALVPLRLRIKVNIEFYKKLHELVLLHFLFIIIYNSSCHFIKGFYTPKSPELYKSHSNKVENKPLLMWDMLPQLKGSFDNPLLTKTTNTNFCYLVLFFIEMFWNIMVRSTITGCVINNSSISGQRPVSF